jgi:hypothetical protein
MSQRWATVLGTEAAIAGASKRYIDIHAGTLNFIAAPADVIAGFGMQMPNVQSALNAAREQGLPVQGNAVTICGTQFELIAQ